MTSDLRLAPNDVTGDVISACDSSSSSDDVPTIDGADDVGGNSENIPEEEERSGAIPSHVISFGGQQHGNDNNNRPSSPFRFRNYRLDTRSFDTDTRFLDEYSVEPHLDTRSFDTDTRFLDEYSVEPHLDTRSFDTDSRFLGEYSVESLGLELLVGGSTLERKILGLRREARLVDEKVRLSRTFLDERQRWMARMADETHRLRHSVLLRTVGGLHHQLARQSLRLRQTLTDISQPPSPAGS